MRALLTAAALSLLASGCGESGPDRDSSRNAGSTANAEARRIEGMSEGERNGVFYRALVDAGHACQNVVSSRRAGEHDGVPLWHAVCHDGRSWFIAITSNGQAQIVRPGSSETAADAHRNASGQR